MKGKWRKLVGPVITTAFLLAYLAYFIICSTLLFQGGFERFIAIALPLGLMGVSVSVLIERILEIRSGEEDDLSKY